MGKWVAILLAVMIGLAAVGFVVDAARWLVGAALLVCVLALAARWALGRRA